MPQLSTSNATPFPVEALAPLDEEGRPLLVVIVQATFSFASGSSQAVEEQPPIHLAGAPYEDAPSTYRVAPAEAFFKPSTDVVLIGHAIAPRSRATESAIGIRVGDVHKSARVMGDRFFYRSIGKVALTDPAPFDRIPLRFERAFGGRDDRHADPSHDAVFAENPLGVGFRSERSPFEDGLRAPNLEDPAHPLTMWAQRVPSATFGFVPPSWPPRALRAGTFDDAWRRDRMPLLPADFNRAFFNAASPGLVSSKHLRGDEAVELTGVTTKGRAAFRLPGVAVRARARLERGRGDVDLAMLLDTLIVDADSLEVQLTWRGHVAAGPLEVRGVRVELGP